MASSQAEQYRRTVAYRGSFPYLDVARRYDVPYRWVLNLVDEFDRLGAKSISGPINWFNATFIAWVKENDRRDPHL